MQKYVIVQEKVGKLSATYISLDHSEVGEGVPWGLNWDKAKQYIKLGGVAQLACQIHPFQKTVSRKAPAITTESGFVKL